MDQNGAIREKRIIDERYLGDVVAYKRDMDAKASSVYRWRDIHASAVVFPAYEEEALRQIEFQLGYLPKRQVTLPDEPFIRQAFYQYDFEHGDFDKLCNDCVIHIQNIFHRISG